MNTPNYVDRRTFLSNLRKSGLLSDEQLATLAAKQTETNRGRVLARTLVRMGWLTKFQAIQLLSGRTAGFHLGQYRILDQLGQGGMGRVFKAQHLAMSRTVALKILAPHLLKTEKAQQLFVREVRTVGRLIHPNIVTAFDANQVGERYYLVLEYIEGPNLDQLVREHGPLPVGQACDFIRQVAQGLQYAFEMGMVHRDIKPANLLVQPTGSAGRGPGQVKISDFGLARLHDTSPDGADKIGTIVTKANTVMGTPDYLSPEQARNLHNVDIRSDLYSLGCTFYFVLTGRVPFPGGTTLEKLVRHSVEEPAPVEQVRPEVPAEVAAIVRRLMAKTPAARFQTPAELAAALTPFAQSSPASWTAPEPAATAADQVVTPVNPASDAGFDALGSDEASALGSTLTPDLSPTPLSEERMPSASRLLKPLHKQQQRRFRFALLLATGLVGGLLAVGVLLYLLLNG